MNLYKVGTNQLQLVFLLLESSTVIALQIFVNSQHLE